VECWSKKFADQTMLMIVFNGSLRISEKELVGDDSKIQGLRSECISDSPLGARGVSQIKVAGPCFALGTELKFDDSR
jgi:hypothetical protein